jgi:divalent metal cation (Fe/Co/Zn/Cd) transporter
MGTPHRSPSDEHLRAALRVSVFSVCWTVAASTTAIVAGLVSRALVLIVFGLTGLLDAVGSWALALHFRHALKHQQVSDLRERNALRVVSAGLLAIGAFTIEESARRLATGSHAETSAVGIAIAAASIIVLTALTLRKRTVSRLVLSNALLADSWLSATGGALAAISVAGAALSSSASWIDPVTALAVALIAAAMGIRFLRNEQRGL